MNKNKTIVKVNVSAGLNKRREFLETARKNVENLNVHISVGNSKMGKIPSFSVLPIVTCLNCAECSRYCYACKGCFNFNDNIKNLAENTAIIESDFLKAFNQINAFLNSGTIIYKYFRFNVAGDVFNLNYLNLIILLAKENPCTKFLVFTKNYKLFNEYLYSFELPKNLNVVFSQWSNTIIENPHNLPVAIVNIPGETNLPCNSFHCGGDCTSCLNCWNAEDGTIRHFDLH